MILETFFNKTYVPTVFLNPGKIKAYKRERQKNIWASDSVKISEVVPPETAFSTKMRVVDFRQVESEPSYSLFVPPNDRLISNATLFPNCHFNYLKNESEPEDPDSKNLYLEWFCDNDISLVVGRNWLDIIPFQFLRGKLTPYIIYNYTLLFFGRILDYLHKYYF